MINFKEIRGLLIPALTREGFFEKIEKSCRKFRVFSDGGATLLVQPTPSGVYDYYTNPDDAEDYGDVTHFILSRKLNIHTHGELHLSKQEFFRLQRELNILGAYSATLQSEHPTPKRPLSGISQKPFRLYDHNILDPDKDVGASDSVISFLRLRGIKRGDEQVNMFNGEIMAVKGDNGFVNPLFVWRDIQGNICGGQYKYIAREKHSGAIKCVKRFLPHSRRENSIWRTSLDGHSALFVCEDPLDALAHRQLYPEKNYAYAATGGTPSAGQIAIIYDLLKSFENANNAPDSSSVRIMPLILGNDNDTAGRLANLRILLPNHRISYDKTNNIINVTRLDESKIDDYNPSPDYFTESPDKDNKTCGNNNLYRTRIDQQEIDSPLNKMIPVADLENFISETAAKMKFKAVIESAPYPAKDWNDVLLKV